MAVRAITSLNLEGKKVLVRCDFNVPMHEGAISDPARIDASLDTIRYVIAHRAIAVLCSHLGRPKERTPALSLKPVAEYLSTALGMKVALAPDCIGDVTLRMIDALEPGQAIVLENLRFHREEEANDRDFAHELARGKSVWINDAFGSAHRAHASTAGVAKFIGERAAGFLMMRELEALRSVTENPARPAIAILGGAKVSDKIGVIKSLIAKMDAILIAGAMAYTFLAARNVAVGKSLVESDKLDLARELLALGESRGVRIILPIDHVVAPSPLEAAAARSTDLIPPDMMGLDIGERTVEAFCAEIHSAKTVIWNGPLGLFETPPFDHGTLAVGEALARTEGIKSIIGGGDTALALGHQPWASFFTHISTGGGATLEYLEGLVLPGVKALE
jgi:phosphoglycerate kinase